MNTTCCDVNIMQCIPLPFKKSERGRCEIQKFNQDFSYEYNSTPEYTIIHTRTTVDSTQSTIVQQ